MKYWILIPLIFSLIFASGCIFPENCNGHYFGEEWQDGGRWCFCDETGIVCDRTLDVSPPTQQMDFEVGECDGSVDPYNESKLGIQEVNWINEFTLEVIADVSVNCAEEILSGNFEKEGSKITLKYYVPDCFEHGDGCAECLCGHRIICTFFNIENAEYEFELEEVNVSRTENDDRITKIIEILDNPEEFEGKEIIIEGTYAGSNSMGGEFQYPESLDCNWSKMGICSKSFNDVIYDKTGCLVFGSDIEILENFIRITSTPANDPCNNYDTWELCTSHPECEGFYADSPCEPNTICPDAISFQCVSKNDGANALAVGNEIKIKGTVMTNLVLEEKKPYLN